MSLLGPFPLVDSRRIDVRGAREIIAPRKRNVLAAFAFRPAREEDVTGKAGIESKETMVLLHV